MSEKAEDVVENVLREWERAELAPEGAGVRRGMALEIRLALQRWKREAVK